MTWSEETRQKLRAYANDKRRQERHEQLLGEALERSRRAEEQSRPEIERERSRRPPDPPDPPPPPLGQPVIARSGTYL